MLEGIDTSHYNGDIHAVVKTVDFGISQCTVGTWKDPAYESDMATFVAAGIYHAAYHYAVYGPGPTRQAAAFLARARSAQWLMVDAEQRGSNRLLQHPATITAIILNIRRLDPLKRKITLYSSRATSVLVNGHLRSIWDVVRVQDANHVADSDGVPNRPGVFPRVPWLFWQYRGIGVDRDRFKGTNIDMEAWIK